MARSMVDLPAPLGPRTTTRISFSIRKLAPVTMGLSPHPKAPSVMNSCSKWHAGGLGSSSLGLGLEFGLGLGLRLGLGLGLGGGTG